MRGQNLRLNLRNFYGEINNALDKQDRKVKIERLIVKCEDAFTRVVDSNDELFDLAQKTEDPDAACTNPEKWLETVTMKTDEFIAAARGYYCPRRTTLLFCGLLGKLSY